MDAPHALSEDDPPAGYNPIDGNIQITVRTDAVTANNSNETTTTYTVTPETIEDETVYTVTIPNNPGVELPSTGGPGTRPFTILGSILVVLTGLMLVKRWRII